MLKKLYVNNFRSFQNFELDVTELKSALLIGKNGSGKTNVFAAMEIFQQIAQGVSKINQLISEKDFAFGDTAKPMRLEISVAIAVKTFIYTIDIELPEGFREPRIKYEKLQQDSQVVFERKREHTQLINFGQKEAGMEAQRSQSFILDWHHFGLPLILVRNEKDPIAQFRNWLKNLLILAPLPSRFAAVSKGERLFLDKQGEYILDWLRNILGENPSLYGKVEDFLKYRFPDFSALKFNAIGGQEKELRVLFAANQNSLDLNFSQLSEGEKIFILAAGLVASMNTDTPFLCLWDEPDNYISLLELQNFIVAQRKAAETKSSVQIIMTSHHGTVIHAFSEHNTFILSRASHLAPTRLQKLAEVKYLSPTLLEAIENGEFE
jgi:predicted ATPase